jgi:rubredoxin
MNGKGMTPQRGYNNKAYRDNHDAIFRPAVNMDTRYCPKCKADLRSIPIPKKDRIYHGGNTHFSRLIGIYDHGLDRTVAWQCPDCKATFAR